MKKDKQSGVSEDLTRLISTLVKDAAKKDSKMTLEEKFGIIDRALKLEIVKYKLKDDDEGSEFGQGDENGSSGTGETD